MDEGSLSRMLRTVLDRFTTELARVGAALPERQYYTVGGAVYDCPQIVIWSDKIQPGIANAQDTGIPVLVGPCEVIWRADLVAAYVVCAAEAPTGPRATGVPRVADVMTDADVMSIAASALAATVESMVNDVLFGSATAQIGIGQPQGGLIAVEAQISTNLWA